MGWVWLSPPQLELGGARDGDEQTVWLHADPLALLRLPRGSDRDAVRRAYRRAARLHHPDAGVASGRFAELQHALRAALGDDEAEVAVEPAEGAWWSFTGFVRPTPGRPAGDGAVVGLVFEAHDLDAVPLRRAEDLVRISYAGRELPLAIRYGRSAAALPVLRARAAALLESAVLALLCLLLFPVIALALALEGYILSGGSTPLFWTAMAGTVALGYGALAAALATAGKPVPYPRRAVARLRGRLLQRPALPRGKR